MLNKNRINKLINIMVFSRLSRNESEKLRRDKLNMHIAELAKLVPIVASAPRKVDKSSVLRLAVNYLRLHKGVLGCSYGSQVCPSG